MKEVVGEFTDDDGVKIQYTHWFPDGEVCAVVQIVHGMSEHIGRYRDLAKRLTEKGFAVVGEDHRGHGRSAVMLGDLGPGGWTATLGEVHQCTQLMKKWYPDKPWFLIGHSWGSFLVQEYLQKRYPEMDDCKGVVLSGTSGHLNRVLLEFSLLAARWEKWRRPHAPNKRMHHLMFFMTFNKRWNKEEDATGFEWISSVDEEKMTYVADPFCGHECSAEFYVDLFSSLKRIWKKENERRIQTVTNILVLSGDDDPVDGFGKGAKILVDRYKRAGIQDIQLIQYPHARHEVFHEHMKHKVQEEVILWMQGRL